MGGLGAAVGGAPPLARPGRERFRDERGRGHHGAVEEDGRAAQRGLGEEARHRRDVGPARPAQQRDRRGGIVVGSYVRRTRPRDLESVVEIEDATDTRQWVGQGGMDWHKEVMHDPDMEHWVLVDRLDRVYAFGILAGLREPGAAELRRMVVAPEGRGQGLGRLLLRHLLEQALARSQVTRVWLDVGADNLRARSLYRSFGFVEKAAPPGAVLHDNGVYMEWSAQRR